jgi:hypothetical protein
MTTVLLPINPAKQHPLFPASAALPSRTPLLHHPLPSSTIHSAPILLNVRAISVSTTPAPTAPTTINAPRTSASTVHVKTASTTISVPVISASTALACPAPIPANVQMASSVAPASARNVPMTASVRLIINANRISASLICQLISSVTTTQIVRLAHCVF